MKRAWSIQAKSINLPPKEQKNSRKTFRYEEKSTKGKLNMKNTETTKTQKYFVNNILSKLTIGFLALTVFCSCSSIGGFSRSTAAQIIEKDKRFNSPVAMTIDIGGRIANAAASIAQMSADETAEQAIPRAKEDFMRRQPQLLIAEELGYIKLYFENGELGERPMGSPRFDDKLGHWFYKPRAEITDKGRALWKDLNLTVDEESLPLAVRGTPEITGMKDENSQTMKSVDFAYKWEPNDLGEAFDPSSDQFKKLSTNLQEALKKTQYNIFGGGGNNTADFKTSRTGKAFFQKFDDGWRLGQLYFM